MATILIANELGLGLGHLNRLLAIAKAFRSARLVFAVLDTGPARRVIEATLGAPAEVISSDPWRHARAPASADADGSWTLADMFAECGFADPGALEAVVAAWRARLAEINPDLVLADFAPMLRIATAGEVPSVVVGNGFTVPPVLSPLPSLRPGRADPSERSQALEAAVLEAANALRHAHGQRPFARLAELFQGEESFAACFDMFDPYRDVRDGLRLQPFNIPHVPLGPPVPQRRGPAVFCYLDVAYRGVSAVVTALNGLAAPSQVFIRHLDPREVARQCAPHVGVHQGPADFGATLPKTRLLVHHGGPGAASAAMLAGTPQLLLPRYLEQELNAKGLEPFGCAVGANVAAHGDPAVVRDIMQRLLNHGEVQASAMSLARRLQAERVTTPERPVVEACRSLLHAATRATDLPN